MKQNQIIIAAVAGLILGIIGGLVLARNLAKPDRFTIQILNQATALKIDKQTGETWRFDYETKETWHPIANSNN